MSKQLEIVMIGKYRSISRIDYVHIFATLTTLYMASQACSTGFRPALVISHNNQQPEILAVYTLLGVDATLAG
jgi:hypothetical protein